MSLTCFPSLLLFWRGPPGGVHVIEQASVDSVTDVMMATPVTRHFMIGFLSGLMLLRLGPSPRGMGSCQQGQKPQSTSHRCTPVVWLVDAAGAVCPSLPPCLH